MKRLLSLLLLGTIIVSSMEAKENVKNGGYPITQVLGTTSESEP